MYIHTDTYTCILLLLLLHCNSTNNTLDFFYHNLGCSGLIYCMLWTVEGSIFGDVSLWLFLCVWNISGKPLNGFVLYSQERCVWSLARASLKVKVKVKVSRDKKRHFSTPSAACVQFMLIKHLQPLVAACSELQKVLFLALSVCGFFVCAWNTSRTAERICAKFTQKTCLVPYSDRRVWRSKVKITRNKIIFRSFWWPVCSLFSKTSLASSWNSFTHRFRKELPMHPS